MKPMFALLLFFMMLCPALPAQIVKTPVGPNLLQWENDYERLKKAKVKEAREYTISNKDSVLSKIIQFDTSGYVISEVRYSYGTVHSRYEYEYNTEHRSCNRFTYENEKRFCDWKNVPDRNGYAMQSYRGFSDGSFEESSSYYFSYKNNQVISAIGKYYDLKEEHYYTYDKTGKMISSREKADSNPEWNWEYTYDAEGRLIKEYWWEKDGQDTSMVAWSKWTYDTDGKILKEEGKGRGWKDINYEWSGDTLKIDFNQGPAFGPSYNYIQHLSSDKKLVTYMKTLGKKGNWWEERCYRYVFYED